MSAPKKPESVAVIIPVHNGRATIDVQLDALAAQDYSGSFEVIVADNGSTDGLAEYLAGHPRTDELALRRVDASDCPGAAHARNVGARSTVADFLAFCDGDDRVHPNWLSELIRTAAAHDAVAGTVETDSLNSELVRSWRQMPDRHDGYSLYRFLPVGISSSFAIWREAFEQVGGWDETFTRGGEDSDMCLRIQLAGMSFGHSPDAQIAYRLRDTLAGIWQQSVMCGEGDVRLYAEYRSYGMPRRSQLALADTVAYLILRNPLLPQFISRVPTGRWLFHAGNLWGRIVGSVRHRVYYL